VAIVKTKQVKIELTQVKNTGNYSSVKVGFDLTIELEENDELEVAKNQAMETLRRWVKEELAKSEGKNG
jgi:hypothetical protein